jgi:ribosomal protein S18 acetylase RimI-like enzyme
VPDDPGAASWRALARLAGGEPLALARARLDLPEGWRAVEAFTARQMTWQGPAGRPRPATPEPEPLGREDIADMARLVALAEPGPFWPGVVDLGPYLGIRVDGELVAMGGMRLQARSYVELCTVCTHPDHRGGGLATAVVSALVERIARRGRRPFLHVATGNPAVHLYERLGFVERARCTVAAVQPPDAAT